MRFFSLSIKKSRGLTGIATIIAAMAIGFFAALLGLSLKHITEYYEEIFFSKAQQFRIYVWLFPAIGLSGIWCLRQYVFRKKPNKGIKEIFESQSSSKRLPSYKIPSHFINGFLTVIFGGSTGIEVSTVVASATIGSVAQSKNEFLSPYKTELTNAGIAAGITVLFGSPLAGLLFCLEVITKKRSRGLFLIMAISISVAYLLILILGEHPLFPTHITMWHYHAIPYFIVLGCLAGTQSAYMTRCVLFFKKLDFGAYKKMLIGALFISAILFCLPQLYGDGYAAIRQNLILHTPVYPVTFFLTLILLVVVKPVVVAITLASGGDGGVFAPGLFMGAFLGLLVALTVNSFGANVIPLNFMLVGMGAVLSASINAPFTALFVVCGITGDYTLFFPILGTCLISRFTARRILPYTVYTYNEKLTAA
jgi:CIC family chloride channel protein